MKKHWMITYMLTICFLNQADTETDEVYAQMTLQPVNKVGQPFILRIKQYLQLCFFYL